MKGPRPLALAAAVAIALAPGAARGKPAAGATPAPPPQTWLSVSLGPGYAHVVDGDAGGLALRVGYEEEKVAASRRRFVFAQELTLFAGRSGDDTVWYATLGFAARRVLGWFRYGGGAALGYGVGPNHDTGHHDWRLPFVVHAETSADVWHGQGLDAYVGLDAGVGFTSWYTASVLVGVRRANRR